MIGKGKKRLTVSLHDRSVECMDEVISLQGSTIQSYSQFVDLAVVYFYLALNGLANNQEGEKNENN